MECIQLDFFKSEEECRLDHIEEQLEKIRLSSERVRKGTYARINEISKKQDQILQEFEDWKRMICKNE